MSTVGRADRLRVVVVGAGAMGLGAAWALLGRGHDVAVLDRFEPGHARGSSHGSWRVFRLGYSEADYIDLARRALPLWRRMEARSGATLLELTGVLDHGPSADIAPVVAAFEVHGVAHEVLSPAAAADRWPGMRLDEEVVVHRDGGRVAAQRSLDVLAALVRREGGVVRHGVAVGGLSTSSASGSEVVQVALAGVDGGTLVADVVIVAAGAWAGKVLDGVVDLPPLQVSAEQPMTFRPRSREAAGWLPFVHRGVEDVYGLGMPGEGVKVAEHYRDEWLDPDDRPFDPDPVGQARVSDYIRRWLPGLDPTPVATARCLYTTTPDKDFVLDRVGPVVVAAGLSGHGFKFTPAVGEVLADLVEGRSTAPARFALGRASRAWDGVK